MPAITGQEVRTQNELRCFCSRRPKLAVYGIDAKGKLYIHIKIYKQRQLFGEILCQLGEVKILCRECLRWHRVNVVQPEKAELQEVPLPNEIEPPPFFRRSE